MERKRGLGHIQKERKPHIQKCAQTCTQADGQAQKQLHEILAPKVHLYISVMEKHKLRAYHLLNKTYENYSKLASVF